MLTINADEIILPDFADIWFTNTQDIRYRVLKGGRETGKSYNFVGMEPIFKLLHDDRRNIMMIRQNDKDNTTSTYVQIKSSAYKLGLAFLFKFTTSPLRITRRSTGQVILFGGMNDVQNITSTAVEHGYWTDIYFEEASQLKSYDDFLVVDGSLRVPPEEEGLWCQITFCMNAWDVGHWTCEVFFEGNLDDDIPTLENERYQFGLFPDFNIGFGYGLALHISSFKCNTHRARDKDESMKIMKEKMYDYYLVAGLGCWGNLMDRTYNHWDDSYIIPHYQMLNKTFDALVIGIDFGMSNGEGRIKYSEDNAKRLGSANVMELVGVSDNWMRLAPIDEYFDSNEGRSEENRKTSVIIQREMIEKIIYWQELFHIQGTIPCYVDCADSGGFIDGLIEEARRRGVMGVMFIPSTKIPILSRVYYENYMMAYGEFTPSSNCPNLIREIKNARKSKEGKPREDFDDHAINAFEYAWIPLRTRLKRWKNFKDPFNSAVSNL